MQKYLQPHTAAIMVGGIDDIRERVGFGVFAFDVSCPVFSAHIRCQCQLCNSRQCVPQYDACASVKNSRRLIVFIRHRIRRRMGKRFAPYSHLPPACMAVA